MRLALLFAGIFLGLATLLPGQSKNPGDIFWVRFTQKEGISEALSHPEGLLSQRSLARRASQAIDLDSTDVPVSRRFLQQLQASGAHILGTSRWMNAALIQLHPSHLQEIRSFSFVQSIKPLGSAGTCWEEKTTDPPPKPIEVLIRDKLDGLDDLQSVDSQSATIWVAVLDAGFPDVAHLVLEERTIGTYSVICRPAFDMHSQIIASILLTHSPEEVQFLWFQTEIRGSESPLEEALWLLAAEYADSAGAAILHTSLGYSRFDQKQFDYTPGQLNGRHALSSQAAHFAFRKGMVVVCAAGNQGNKSWGHLDFPADAEGVIAVGAVPPGRKKPCSFSPTGPTADGRLKPEVVAQGSKIGIKTKGARSYRWTKGTSYAAPQVSALAATLWSAFPQATNQEIREALLRSGSTYANPDPSSGYGRPDGKKAWNWLQQRYPR